jgi:hypothetical protein
MKEEFMMARTRIKTMLNGHLGAELVRDVIIR